MKTLIKGAALALVLAGASLSATAPASAATGISLNFGNVAFGYTDGYWDQSHRWHSWRNRAEARAYRARYSDHYYAYSHNHNRHDKNHGWRNDNWWSHH